jgi:hypothetical protein
VRDRGGDAQASLPFPRTNSFQSAALVVFKGSHEFGHRCIALLFQRQDRSRRLAPGANHQSRDLRCVQTLQSSKASDP